MLLLQFNSRLVKMLSVSPSPAQMVIWQPSKHDWAIKAVQSRKPDRHIWWVFQLWLSAGATYCSKLDSTGKFAGTGPFCLWCYTVRTMLGQFGVFTMSMFPSTLSGVTCEGPSLRRFWAEAAFRGVETMQERVTWQELLPVGDPGWQVGAVHSWRMVLLSGIVLQELLSVGSPHRISLGRQHPMGGTPLWSRGWEWSRMSSWDEVL